MATRLSAIKGTKDILPDEASRWQHVEAIARQLMDSYDYGEIRTPVFEHTTLFVRGVGEGTDIVSKEMYSFETKGDDPTPITLRPENTAGVVRAVIEHKLFARPLPLKLWYVGPMFRYERPQKGRQRQFHQLGAECLGSEDPRFDAEAIVLACDLLRRLGLHELQVQLNSVGCDACRPAYRERLQGYLREQTEALCTDCTTRTEKNPLRVLDCKIPPCQPIIQAAPSLADSLCEACRENLGEVRAMLESVGQPYQINPRLVRGLDYYTRTVFEIVSISGQLGAQNTVCAGGRYNELVEELGGPRLPAVGWGLGLERLLMLLPDDIGAAKPLDVLLVAAKGDPEVAAFAAAHSLRQTGLKVELASAGKFDKQLKQAVTLGARFAVIIGPDELLEGVVAVKNLQTREQTKVPREGLVDWFAGQGAEIVA